MTDSPIASVLHIEDEEDFRRELVEELEALNYRAYGAADGDAALAFLDARPAGSIQCIICDVMMPGRSGPELIEALLDHPAVAPAAPFILLTALAARCDMLAGLLAGADDYLVKPVDLDLLVLTIQNRMALAKRAGRTAGAPDDVPPSGPALRDVPEYLSRRDVEVLTLLGQGAKNPQIAEMLCLSRHTINQYVRDIYRKLDINSRFEAARLAREMGLTDETKPSDG